MHSIKYIEYNAYDAMHRLKCNGFTALNVMHISQSYSAVKRKQGMTQIGWFDKVLLLVSWGREGVGKDMMTCEICTI